MAEAIFALIRDAFAGLSESADGPFSIAMRSKVGADCEVVITGGGPQRAALRKGPGESETAERAQRLAGSHAGVCKEVNVVIDVQASTVKG